MYRFPSDLATKLLLVSALLLGCVDRCNAANAPDISSDGCVDKSGFEICISDADSQQAICANGTSSIDLILSCAHFNKVEKMNCYMTNCWNKIYSCEYSALAAQYSRDRQLIPPDPIPFWPAPDNAPGGCSCNIGKAYLNSSGDLQLAQNTNCMEKFTGSDPEIMVSVSFACSCCTFDGALSAIYAICPHNNPDFLGFSDYLSGLHSFEDQVNTGKCSSVIGDSCVSTYGISPPAGEKFYDPDTLYSSFGNDPYSTTAGTVTSPPGGPTMTWPILDREWTVVAVSAGDSSGSSDIVVTTTDAAGSAIISTVKSTATGTAANSADNLSGRIQVVIWVPVMIGALWVEF